MHELINKYLKIYKKDKLIASGRVAAVKTNHGVLQSRQSDLFISFDLKTFYNGKGKNIRVEKCSSTETFVDTTIKLRKIHWRYIGLYCKFFSADSLDAVIEFTKDELDPEVIPLVRALNNCPGIRTVGSCSGHRRHKPWIQCHCEGSFDKTFLFFYKLILLSKFNSKIRICNDSLTTDPDSFLITTFIAKGKKAWKDFDELAEYLEGLT